MAQGGAYGESMEISEFASSLLRKNVIQIVAANERVSAQNPSPIVITPRSASKEDQEQTKDDEGYQFVAALIEVVNEWE